MWVGNPGCSAARRDRISAGGLSGTWRLTLLTLELEAELEAELEGGQCFIRPARRRDGRTGPER